MTLESARLHFERITSSHAAELATPLCDPLVYAFVEDRTAPTPDELLASFTRKQDGPPPARASEIWIDFAVRLKASGTAIGRIEATVLADRAEIGYLFGRRHWGFGFAQEAVAWLHAWVRERHGVTTFWATVSPDNARSTALLTVLGYRPTPPDCWPDRLLSHIAGDLVFRLRHDDAAAVTRAM